MNKRTQQRNGEEKEKRKKKKRKEKKAGERPPKTTGAEEPRHMVITLTLCRGKCPQEGALSRRMERQQQQEDLQGQSKNLAAPG